ncbi:type IV toxin-antitoxin system AbiEi family antitoxin domain-containing protein [Specibacter cremeus]|uniref:type IV toxin-antitoxin system AbiEi family antitoxin domain-containing protein n=1 Tax=Specibacter cremeus TaxID=1629051 RepID=UPI000F7AE0B6|nr:type IV toxin-antitoxin system AbiEi family antitoxin domain-containing protein [Specibacter cremeus]
MDSTKLTSTLRSRWPRNIPEGIATTAVLTRAGISDRLLTEAVRSRILVRIRRGAYVPASIWENCSSWDKDLLRLNRSYVGFLPGFVEFPGGKPSFGLNM